MVMPTRRQEMTLEKLSDEIQAGLLDDDVDSWVARLKHADDLRLEAGQSSGEDIANKAWFLVTVCTSRLDMIRVWKMLLEANFQEAWIELEKIELACRRLKINSFYPLDEFQIDELASMVSNWQSLFPYKIFLSPEFIISHEECSICGQSMGPWSSCPHTTGRVYNGEFCSRIVKEASFGHIALVTDPVQKYSVLIPRTEDGSDPMDYRQVEWVRDRCNGPFCKFSIQRGRMLHPHSSFSNSASDLCPCGSEKSYESCCLPKDGVSMPHLDVSFGHAVDPALLGVHLSGRRVSD